MSSRRLLAFAALSIPLVLAGCPGDFDGGYDKVAFRERGDVLMAAAPNPPPVIAGFGAAGAGEIPTLANAPAGVTQEMVEGGAQLFGTVCAACHGPGGSGTGAGPALSDSEWLHIGGGYEEIVSLIQSGVANPIEYPAPMPPMGGGSFSEEEVRQLGAYVLAISQGPA